MTQIAETIELGNHSFVSYKTKEEKLNDAFNYLHHGLRRNEAVLLITEDMPKDQIRKRMADEWRVDIDTLERNGDINIKTDSEWYLIGGFPNSQRTTALFIALVESSINRGKRGLRVVGDMQPFFKRGFTKELIEFECSLEKKLGFPLTALCAYHTEDLESLTKGQLEGLRLHHYPA
ncbi:MAG: MEDS domain-containing protein [Nitrososphaerales archaeon]